MKTKKIVSILAVCALMLTLFSALPALAATNHLTDSIGFEGDSYTSASTFDGWNINSTNSSKVSAEVTEEKAYSGSKSLEVTVLDENGGQINYNGSQTLVAGTEYKVSMMVCIPSALGDGASTGGVQIRVNYASNGSDGTTTLYFGGPTYYLTGDAWQEISGTFVATDTTNLAFRFRSGAPVNSIFYVDDIAVYSTEELQAEAEAEAAERAAKNFSYVSEYRKVYDDEYYNSMEGTNFNVFKLNISVDTTVKHQGTGSLKMQLTEDSINNAYACYINEKTYPTFKNGLQYEASAWMYIPAESEITSVMLRVRLNGSASDIGEYVQKKVNVTNAKGEWIRIYIPFTMNQDNTAKTIILGVDGAKDAVIYWDDLTIVRKQSQNAVLQITKPVTLVGGDTLEADVVSPGAGAFTVKYDFHKANETNAGKTLIAGIYKDTDAGKQLVEVKLVTVGAADTAVTIPMTGIENPDESYSLKVMYWDSLAGMFGYRTAEFAF